MAEALPQRVNRRRKRTGNATSSTDEGENKGKQGNTDQDLQKVDVRPALYPSGGSSYHKNDRSLNKYEYTDDHPADVQLHSWGKNLSEAFEFAALALFNYETSLKNVEKLQECHLSAEGHDAISLLYNFLNECLYLFSGEGIVCSHVHITELCIGKYEGEGKPVHALEAICYGEPFNLEKHKPLGTEVKAVTYSNMQIYGAELNGEGAKKGEGVGTNASNWAAELYVILDI